MGKRKLLKARERLKLLDVPADEDSLIRHYSLSPADRLEVGLRRREHNQLGFAVQLCLMRCPGRVLGPDETPPRAMLKYVAEQIGVDPGTFALYARREETRRDHTARLMVYLDTRARQRKTVGLLYWLRFKRPRCRTTVLRQPVPCRDVS